MVGHQLLGKQAYVWSALLYPIEVMRDSSAKIGGETPRLIVVYGQSAQQGGATVDHESEMVDAHTLENILMSLPFKTLHYGWVFYDFVYFPSPQLLNEIPYGKSGIQLFSYLTLQLFLAVHGEEELGVVLGAFHALFDELHCFG